MVQFKEDKQKKLMLQERQGAEDLAHKLEKSEIKVDRVLATPDMMSTVGKLGKVLGPKGLMPNPKLGTVTTDLKQ